MESDDSNKMAENQVQIDDMTIEEDVPTTEEAKKQIMDTNNAFATMYEKLQNPLREKILQSLPPDIAELNRFGIPPYVPDQPDVPVPNAARFTPDDIKKSEDEHVLNFVRNQIKSEDQLAELEEQKRKTNAKKSPNIPMCFECCELTINPLTCEGCRFEVYCNKECQKRRWDAKHNVQCKAISLTMPTATPTFIEPYTLDVNGGVVMANHLRSNRPISAGEVILQEIPLAMVFYYNFDQIKDLPEPHIDMIAGSNRKLFGEKYLSFDHTGMYQLPEAKRSSALTNPMLFRLTDALLTTEPWLAKNTFYQTAITGTSADNEAISDLYQHHMNRCKAKNITDVPTLKEVSYLVGTMLVNSFTVCPMLLDTPLSIAFFPKMSMLNHSCNPNVFYYYKDGYMTCRASRAIPSGTELTIDYMSGRSPITSRGMRSTFLKNFVRFTCRCDKCKASEDFVSPNWTIESSNDVTLKQKISKDLPILSKKYVSKKEYINAVIELWEEKKESLRNKPMVLVNLTLDLVIAQCTSRYTGAYKDKDGNVKTNKKILTESGKMVQESLIILSHDTISNLRNGETRNLDHVKIMLHAGHLIIVFKYYIMTIVDNPTDGLDLVMHNFNKMPQANKDAFKDLISADIRWFKSNSFGFESLYIDVVLSSIVQPLTSLLHRFGEILEI